MDDYLVWILTATALVVVELLTGSYYLFALGVAAAAGAALAYAGAMLWVQLAVAALTAVVGIVLVYRYRARLNRASSINAIDVGHRVTFESWVNEREGLARVHYRGTTWDAKVIGPPGAGNTFYVRGVEGGTLQVAPER